MTARDDRLHEKDGSQDQRQPFPRDRDRIAYASAFKRLAGVTQVVGADEGILFHNRLTHSLKVAQVARRLAEYLVGKDRSLADQLDPDVAEAAGLGHDLGHPPFGHIGEHCLSEKLRAVGCSEGYEGNPQSFRVVTRLSIRIDEVDGLNLTRATLAALMKYPWMRDEATPKRSKKWGAYRSDKEAFDFAREGLSDGQRTLEAQVMDWADDIAYSVHDLEDFHRAGMIPWSQLRADTEERQKLIEEVEATWRPAGAISRVDLEDAAKLLFDELLPVVMLEPFLGNRVQRQALRFWTATLIGRYIRPTTIHDGKLLTAFPAEIAILKQLTRRYVINNAALAAQQYGQRRVLAELFDDLLEAATDPKKRNLFPHRNRHLLDDAPDCFPRAVADAIASMTEAEVIAMHKRLRGHEAGTVLNPIVR